MCVRAIARAAHAHAQTCILNACCAAIFLRSQKQVFFDCHNCGSSLINSLKKKAVNYSGINSSENLILLCISMGKQALIPSVILSLCFEGTVTQRQALLCLCLDTVHLSSWRDNGSRHWFIWPEPDAGSRGTEGGWKWALNVFWESVSCVLCLVLCTRLG